MNVVAVDVADDKLSLARRLGADETINASAAAGSHATVVVTAGLSAAERQAMLEAARPVNEVIAGLFDDATFGPVPLFGAGGRGVEVMADKALGLPPLDAVLARDPIAATRIGRLMQSYRDRPPVDISGTVRTLVALSLAADLPQVAELDINPLLVNAAGVIALDARVRLIEAPFVAQGGNPRMAIRPYPLGWEQTTPVRDGSILIQPIRPQDERLYPEFLKLITAADMRRRFFGTFSNFDHG